MTSATTHDYEYQLEILKEVSRTFALTIPQLPNALSVTVANAYLLCRIADTIEDDAKMSASQKREFTERFVAVVENETSADEFGRELAPLLYPGTLAAERDLIANSAAVLRITHACNHTQQRTLSRCVRIMVGGMADYQDSETLAGLKDMQAMDRYCYFVAGVVGEMLTELFCDYSTEIAERKEQMLKLAVSFGQGLQMTNILKDIWDDRERGACWLPQQVFSSYGCELANLRSGEENPGFAEGLGELIDIARAHLHNALTYTLLIPHREKGIRRFCLWALGMAVLSLDKLNKNRDFNSGLAVKISRRSVRATVLLTSTLVTQDRWLSKLFTLATRNLPGNHRHETLTRQNYGANSRT